MQTLHLYNSLKKLTVIYKSFSCIIHDAVSIRKSLANQISRYGRETIHFAGKG